MKTFWRIVSLWSMYLPVSRSSFQKIPGLPIVITSFSPAVVDDHALERFVEIGDLARRVLEMPRELAGVGVQRERGRRVEQGPLPDWRLARIHGLACATPQYVRFRPGS